ncbi:hypothetical protein RUM43_003313 [Polyplax serrata]|uniref:Uncharacterized protein n=1 Tax=Polyplax serrata TaxID=468196 RepID=A0AAN8S9D3_POLSC
MAIRTAKKRPNKKAHATDPLMPHSNAYVPRSSPLLLALIPMARPKRKPKTAPQMSPSPIDGFIILSVRRHLDLLVVNSDVFFATIFSRPNQLFSLTCLSPFPFVGFVGTPNFEFEFSVRYSVEEGALLLAQKVVLRERDPTMSWQFSPLHLKTELAVILSHWKTSYRFRLEMPPKGTNDAI